MNNKVFVSIKVFSLVLLLIYIFIRPDAGGNYYMPGLIAYVVINMTVDVLNYRLLKKNKP